MARYASPGADQALAEAKADIEGWVGLARQMLESHDIVDAAMLLRQVLDQMQPDYVVLQAKFVVSLLLMAASDNLTDLDFGGE